jgi:dTDP-4-amino-4,6-dideoxygalactose transaminase
MDGLQAAILTVKLPHLPAWTRARKKLANDYTAALSGIPGLTTPHVAEGRDPVWHLYVIRHERRDELAKFLAARDIQTVINYPVALPFLPAYKRLKHVPTDFPNAHRHQSEILSLPIFPEMTAAQFDAVLSGVREFCKSD